MKYFYYLVCLIIFLCYSCTNETEKWLVNAERIVNEYPDSALWFLVHIDFPEKLPDSQKAAYGWLTTQAHSNLNMALKNDSSILFSLEYYKNNGPADKLFSSYKFAIRHAYWNEEIEKASFLIEEGLQTALALNDSIAISQFYYRKTNLQSPEETLISYQKMKEYDKSLEARADYLTGLLYARTGNIDSTKYYFEKSIEIACSQQDTLAGHYIRNYGDFLYALGEIKEVRRQMQRAIDYDPDYSNSNSSLYTTLALTYLKENRLDSAQYFLDKAKCIISNDPDKDSPIHLTENNSVYNIQLILDYAQEKHININDLNSYNNTLAEEISLNQSEFREVVNIQNLLEQHNLRLKIKHQKNQLLLTLLISLFIICGGLLYIYIQKKRQKYQEIEEKSEILEHLLKETLSGDPENTQTPVFFKKILLQQLGLIRLVATSPTAQNQALLQQISLISNDKLPVDSLLVWEDLYPIIDSIYDNFYTDMHTKYKDRLLEKEIQLCCLLCAEFSTKEISVITQQSVRTIYQRKTTIRQKLGIDEKGDIVDFIKNKK